MSVANLNDLSLIHIYQRKEGGMQMDEQFKSDIRNIVSQAFKEINSENAERDAEIESYNCLLYTSCVRIVSSNTRMISRQTKLTWTAFWRCFARLTVLLSNLFWTVLTGSLTRYIRWRRCEAKFGSRTDFRL